MQPVLVFDDFLFFSYKVKFLNPPCQDFGINLRGEIIFIVGLVMCQFLVNLLLVKLALPLTILAHPLESIVCQEFLHLLALLFKRVSLRLGFFECSCVLWRCRRLEYKVFLLKGLDFLALLFHFRSQCLINLLQLLQS